MEKHPEAQETPGGAFTPVCFLSWQHTPVGVLLCAGCLIYARTSERAVQVDCDDGSVFAWPVCCPEAILQKFLQTKDYCYHVERALRNNAGSLTPILYEDEAVAGNVLGPLQQSKCNLYYLSFLATSLL